jgi:hypothetical protein
MGEKGGAKRLCRVRMGKQEKTAEVFLLPKESVYEGLLRKRGRIQ